MTLKAFVITGNYVNTKQCELKRMRSSYDAGSLKNMIITTITIPTNIQKTCRSETFCKESAKTGFQFHVFSMTQRGNEPRLQVSEGRLLSTVVCTTCPVSRHLVNYLLPRFDKNKISTKMEE